MLNIRCLFCTSGTTLMCALSVASAAHGQASTTACFLHVYNATTANNKTALSAAVDGFNNAACSTKLRPIASTSPLSEPTLENAVFLAFKQSEQRLWALNQGARQAPFVTPRKDDSIGGESANKIPVSLKTANGGTVLAEVPASAISRELLEKLAKPGVAAKR